MPDYPEVPAVVNDIVDWFSGASEEEKAAAVGAPSQEALFAAQAQRDQEAAYMAGVAGAPVQADAPIAEPSIYMTPMAQAPAQEQAPEVGAYSQAQLEELIPVGGTGTSRWGEQRIPGKPMPSAPLLEERDKEAAAYQEKLEARKRQLEAGEKEQQASRLVYQSLKEKERAKGEEERADYLASYEAKDKERAVIRQQMREHKTDSGRIFSGPEGVLRKLAFAIAAGGQGFVMGMRGQAGPNPILQMMEAAINRDVALQEAEYDKMKGDLGEVDNDFSRMMKVYGNTKDARREVSIKIREDFQDLMDGYKAKTTNQKIIANIEDAQHMIDQAGIDKKIAWEQESRERVVKTRGGGGTTQRATRGSLLAKAAKAKGAAAKGAKPDKMPKDILEQVGATVESAEREKRYAEDLASYQQDAGMGETPASSVWQAAKHRLKREIPGTEAERIQGEFNELTGLRTKVMSGAAATEIEFDRNKPKTPGPGDQPSLVAKKRLSGLRASKKRLETVIGLYPDAPKRYVVEGHLDTINKAIKKMEFEAGE